MALSTDNHYEFYGFGAKPIAKGVGAGVTAPIYIGTRSNKGADLTPVTFELDTLEIRSVVKSPGSSDRFWKNLAIILESYHMYAEHKMPIITDQTILEANVREESGGGDYHILWSDDPEEPGDTLMDYLAKLGVLGDDVNVAGISLMYSLREKGVSGRYHIVFKVVLEGWFKDDEEGDIFSKHRKVLFMTDEAINGAPVGTVAHRLSAMLYMRLYNILVEGYDAWIAKNQTCFACKQAVYTGEAVYCESGRSCKHGKWFHKACRNSKGSAKLCGMCALVQGPNEQQHGQGSGEQ